MNYPSLTRTDMPVGTAGGSRVVGSFLASFYHCKGVPMQVLTVCVGESTKMNHNTEEMEPTSQESLFTVGMFPEVSDSARSYDLDYLLKEDTEVKLGACNGLPASPMQNLQNTYLCHGSYFGDNSSLISDVLPSPDNTQLLCVTPTVLQSTSKLPCKDEYPGPYNFMLELKSETSEKFRWMYSQSLKKVFVNMHSKIPIQFKWTQHELGLRIRALPVYCAKEAFERPVLRCPNHSSLQEPSNEGFKYVNHVIRCGHKQVEYHTDPESQRTSVVIPMDLPQPGTDWVTVIYTFMCKNSCFRNIKHRDTAIIFTLERITGEVLGRRTMSLRVCSCPKRDMAKKEKESPRVALPEKRLMGDKPHHPYVKKKSKVNEDHDMVTIMVLKKHAKRFAQYMHGRIAGQAALDKRRLTHCEKEAMKNYENIMNSSKLPAMSLPGKFN